MRFELRSHFVSRLSLIVQVNVVLNSTVVVDGDSHFDNLCSIVIFRVKVSGYSQRLVSCIMSDSKGVVTTLDSVTPEKPSMVLP